MKVVNQVNETTDYSMFKTLVGNRNVNKLHISRLEQSFNEKYLFSPILVNQKYEIIDGQHRFQAAKNLKLPISFMIVNDYGLKEVQLLNTNMKNWKKEDYLQAHCDLGRKEYLKFKQFMLDYPDFGILACEIFLTNLISGGKQTVIDGKKASRNDFQKGDLIIPDIEKSKENAEKILMIKPFYSGFYRATFVRSMLGIFQVEDYNHAKFIERLNASPNSLSDCNNITQYKLLVEDIYNYRSRTKVSLRF